MIAHCNHLGHYSSRPPRRLPADITLFVANPVPMAVVLDHWTEQIERYNTKLRAELENAEAIRQRCLANASKRVYGKRAA